MVSFSRSLCQISAHVGLSLQSAPKHMVRFDLEELTLIYFPGSQHSVLMHSYTEDDGVKDIALESLTVRPTASPWTFDVSLFLKIRAVDDWVQARTYDYSNVVAQTCQILSK